VVAGEEHWRCRTHHHQHRQHHAGPAAEIASGSS
jgi:hypothetical protein